MENDWTKVLGFPGYRVYQQEIDEEHQQLKLWIRRKRGNRSMTCAGCGRRVHKMHEVYEREIRDLPCFEYQTTRCMNERSGICRALSIKPRWWWNCIGWIAGVRREGGEGAAGAQQVALKPTV